MLISDPHNQMDTAGRSWPMAGGQIGGGVILAPPYPELIGPGMGPPSVRTFETGATRDTDQGKPDYEGFLSPLVIRRFGEYMHKNRLQKDGSLRDGDNWQKGIPLTAYMKSGWRHFMEWWQSHRDSNRAIDQEEALCALLFNVQGYLHETLKTRGY